MCMEKREKLTKVVIDYDANILYLYCSGNKMPCGKEMVIVNNMSFDQERIAKLSKDVLKGKFFGFAQVDIEIPNGALW